jgi:uncharacterized membrane protein
MNQEFASREITPARIRVGILCDVFLATFLVGGIVELLNVPPSMMAYTKAAPLVAIVLAYSIYTKFIPANKRRIKNVYAALLMVAAVTGYLLGPVCANGLRFLYGLCMGFIDGLMG